MVLDNVAVRWPRTGDYYEPVPASEFADFAQFAGPAAPGAGHAGRAADDPGVAGTIPHPTGTTTALAQRIAQTSTVAAAAYTDLVDLLLGLDGVLYATDSAEEDEDPVIDPDGCAWIAGGLERFITAHHGYGHIVTFDTAARVLRDALRDNRLAAQQLRWLDSRLDARRDANGAPPDWAFAVQELAVLAAFYRRCATRGYAVYARS